MRIKSGMYVRPARAHIALIKCMAVLLQDCLLLLVTAQQQHINTLISEQIKTFHFLTLGTDSNGKEEVIYS